MNITTRRSSSSQCENCKQYLTGSTALDHVCKEQKMNSFIIYKPKIKKIELHKCQTCPALVRGSKVFCKPCSYDNAQRVKHAKKRAERIT